MTRLALWAASVVVAWWLGREYEWRQASAMDARADEMDAVQPADPVTLRSGGVMGVYTPFIVGESGPELIVPNPWVNTCMASDNLDLTYTDAITRAAIRRTAQRDDVSTGGM